MRRSDRAAWSSARTLCDLGLLTAAWLEGELGSQPGVASEVGADGATWQQRAAVQGWRRPG